jgi:transitional endoplasmic reticulum ATPase
MPKPSNDSTVRGAKRARSAARPESQTACWILRALIRCGAAHSVTPPKRIGIEQLRSLGVRLPKGTIEPAFQDARVIAAIDTRLREIEQGPLDGSMGSENAALLGKLLGLSRAETAVLALVVALDTDDLLRDCFLALQSPRIAQIVGHVARVLGLRRVQVEQALRREGMLRGLRLVDWMRVDLAHLGPLTLGPAVADILLRPLGSEADIAAHFLEAAPPPTLELCDYPHLALDIDLLRRFLRGALDRRAAGINVLIHGLPGTGKTELTRALARALGARLESVSLESSSHEVKVGQARLESYALCQRMMRRRRATLLLFDEAEDAFPRGGGSSPQAEPGRNKAWINQLLEQNAVPAFWISNTIDQIDRAFLRRFDFVLEVGQPPRSVRQRVLDKHLRGLKIDPRQREQLAEREDLSPGHVERAARVLRLLRPRTSTEAHADLERVVNANLRAYASPRTGGQRSVDMPYDLSLLQMNADAGQLVGGLAASRRATVCFYGPPGTGKTALAHHIARELGQPMIDHRASDLLSKWLGDTEKNIARMFERARDDNAVLLLDEAESFLADRRGAHHSWEVTQVNEMLTQMERFTGVFICSTNLMENLDRAALRRFAIKIRFDYLTAAQGERLFRSVLRELRAEPEPDATRSALEELRGLRNLTPGDFAAVLRKLRMLGTTPEPSTLFTALRDESELKGEGRARSLGFR